MTKNILESKTIWGALLMIVSFVVHAIWGVEITTDETGAIVETIGTEGWAATVSAVIGLAVTVYGRVKAKKGVKILGR